VVSGVGIVVDDTAQVIQGHSTFAIRGGASHAFAAAQGTPDEDGRASFADVREEWFELVANTRKIRFD